VKDVILQNSDFLFGFEAVMTNPNGDPDQENRPRMDYETATTLVSDARRKRDCRDILKRKGYAIFVDTFDDNKIPMDYKTLNRKGIKVFCVAQGKVREVVEKFKRGELEEALGPNVIEYWNIQSY
jgi:Cas7 group CRISPR-associated protein Csh2